MEIHFMAPLPAIAKRTRIAKMVKHFTSHGFNIKFHGWERIDGEALEQKSNNLNIEESIILRGGGYSSSKARAMYPLWMIKCFFNTFRIGRNKIIFCLGWESAFPALIASKLTGSQVIFDDADRFSLIISLPKFAKKALQKLEQWTSTQAFLHIIPSFSRYEWRSSNMMPLRNTPLRHDFEEALKKQYDTSATDFIIYANGWIGETRGASIFLHLIESLSQNNIKIKMVIAGRLDSQSGNSLANHPSVEFHGEVNQSDALSFYPSSHVVLTFYDPSIPINRKAESNKWGDCVFFRTPFIVNSEVETATHFVTKGAAFHVPYHDSAALTDLILNLYKNRSRLEHAREKLAEFDSDYPIFDDQLSNILSLLTSGSQK